MLYIHIRPTNYDHVEVRVKLVTVYDADQLVKILHTAEGTVR